MSNDTTNGVSITLDETDAKLVKTSAYRRPKLTLEAWTSYVIERGLAEIKRQDDSAVNAAARREQQTEALAEAYTALASGDDASAKEAVARLLAVTNKGLARKLGLRV